MSCFHCPLWGPNAARGRSLSSGVWVPALGPGTRSSGGPCQRFRHMKIRPVFMKFESLNTEKIWSIQKFMIIQYLIIRMAHDSNS